MPLIFSWCSSNLPLHVTTSSAGFPTGAGRTIYQINEDVNLTSQVSCLLLRQISYQIVASLSFVPRNVRAKATPKMWLRLAAAEAKRAIKGQATSAMLRTGATMQQSLPQR